MTNALPHGARTPLRCPNPDCKLCQAADHEALKRENKRLEKELAACQGALAELRGAAAPSTTTTTGGAL